MSATSFNRARRQAEALSDAKARDDEAQNKPLNQKMSVEELNAFARDQLPDMASPPYPDIRKLVNIPSGSDREREIAAAKESELNKLRVLSDAARNELQNAHLRDDKVKAIPDHDEAGQDRSTEGMKSLQEEAYKDYEDPRAPQHDGRIRATEPYEDRPDADTSVSKNSRTKPTKLVEDDKPETVGKIADKHESRIVPTAETFEATEENAKARKAEKAASSPPSKSESKTDARSESKPEPKPVETPKVAASASEANKEAATKPVDAPKAQPTPVPGTVSKDK
jgi:hypothetical protein